MQFQKKKEESGKQKGLKEVKKMRQKPMKKQKSYKKGNKQCENARKKVESKKS